MNGKVDILVGGQYGSEGKGKASYFIAKNGTYGKPYGAFVRGGGENAGHTFYDDDKDKHVTQVVPVGAFVDEAKIFVGPGSVFTTKQLFKEMDESGCHDRILIDRNAGVITEEHKDIEAALSLSDKIGSTAHGCGAAMASKVMRNGFLTAKDYKELSPYVGNVPMAINGVLRSGKDVFLEGTQGTLLSLDHTLEYPYATSRNATSSAIAAECGVGPKDIRHIILTLRTFPIRVGGNSGPAKGREMTWDEMMKRSRKAYPELTTVTKKTRRVFEFSMEELRYAIMLNTPTHIAMMFADYFNDENAGVSCLEDLTHDISDWMADMWDETGIDIGLIGTGPHNRDMVNLGPWSGHPEDWHE